MRDTVLKAFDTQSAVQTYGKKVPMIDLAREAYKFDGAIPGKSKRNPAESKGEPGGTI